MIYIYLYVCVVVCVLGLFVFVVLCVFADLIMINKADGNNIENTKKACAQYKNSLALFSKNENGWITQVGTCAGLYKTGLEDTLHVIKKYTQLMKANGSFITNRSQQKIYWLHRRIKEELGNKKYLFLKKNNTLNQLENKLNKGDSIYKLIEKL